MRQALLAQARKETSLLESEAAVRAASYVSQAQRQVAEQVLRARTEGALAAEREAMTELARARRKSRALVLEAQRSVWETVRAEAHSAAQQLRAEPRYSELVQRLAEDARARLGPSAELELDPPQGGVVARAGNMRLDYSLPALVERCLAEHGADLEHLWE